MEKRELRWTKTVCQKDAQHSHLQIWGERLLCCSYCPVTLVEASGGISRMLRAEGALAETNFLSRGLLGRRPVVLTSGPAFSASQCRGLTEGPRLWALRTRLLNPRLKRAATCSTWKQNTLHK